MAKITGSTIEAILRLSGGRENIPLCGNCMTRLRLTLNNRELVQPEELKKKVSKSDLFKKEYSYLNMTRYLIDSYWFFIHKCSIIVIKNLMQCNVIC